MSYPKTGEEVYVSLNLSNTMLTGLGKGTITREDVSVDYLKKLFMQHGVIVSAKPEYRNIMERVNSTYEDEDEEYEDDFPDLRDRGDTGAFADRRSAERKAEDRRNKVVNINATTQLKVVLVKPERFENASEIADHLKEKRTVVINLESTNKDIARRLIDFLSGVAYAGEGKIKKVAANTYIITPYHVDIMGDLIDEMENNGLYL